MKETNSEIKTVTWTTNVWKYGDTKSTETVWSVKRQGKKRNRCSMTCGKTFYSGLTGTACVDGFANMVPNSHNIKNNEQSATQWKMVWTMIGFRWFFEENSMTCYKKWVEQYKRPFTKRRLNFATKKGITRTEPTPTTGTGISSLQIFTGILPIDG